MPYSDLVGDLLSATVNRIERLNPDIVGIHLDCPEIAHYRAGQYLRLFIEGQKARIYSLASAPGIDQALHLHVRRNANGVVSRWLHETLEVGVRIQVSRPEGHSYYQPADLERPLLLLGTGSGLAPLYGIAREALRQGHRGEIRLYHGVRQREELYLVEQLRALARLNANFRYVPCLSRSTGRDCHSGRALDLALRETPLSARWCVYLSGNPGMVNDAFPALQAAGVAADAILSDQLPAVVSGYYARAA